MGVTGIGFFVTLLISGYASRFALQRIRDGDEILEIELVEDETEAQII